MTITEAEILRNFLLNPSQLPTIISLPEFAKLFPRSLQSSPQVKRLYRDLQNQRNHLVDSVSADIEKEVKQGKALRRAIMQERQTAEAQEYDDELKIERALFGTLSNGSAAKHSVITIIPDLEKAVKAIEGELEDLEHEETGLSQSVRQTIGNMSDLRYGRLANDQLPEQVLEGLANLQEACKSKA